MTLIRRPSPFGELLSLRQAMDRLFEDSYVRPRGGGAGPGDEHQLALDIYTTADSLVVEAALPGVKPDDVEISVLGDTLTINATTTEDQTRNDDGYSYREIRRGSFSRQVTLPGGLKSEAATASFENGMLRLSIPKAEEAKPRQIQIKPSTSGASASQAGTSEGGAGQADFGQGSAEAANAQPVNDWQSNQSPDWQSTSPALSGQSTPSGDEWPSGNEWQSNGQGQTNEQPRVEQGS